MDGTTAPRSAPEGGRRRFTADEVSRMVEAGILGDKEPYELIGGELIEMPSEGALNSDIKAALLEALYAACAGRYSIGPDTPLRLSDTDWPEPDAYLLPKGLRPSAARGPDTLLVVEVSDTSLAVDLGLKAELYARHDVREYWVIDLPNRLIHVHALQADGIYGEALKVDAGSEVSPRLAPEIAIRLVDLL